ncbi:hypothetical protein RCH14_004540 [Massilia sp. MP_M2]|uniref:hypothetical protein n=1 Tax=Massilia sp. MP_M2 TaxID=3071713 RepID=UPI00319E0F08
MKNQPLNRMAQAVRGSFDRRTIGGIVIGAAIMMSTMATAQTGGGWFSGLFSSSGATGGSANNALISQQDSVVTASINEEAEKCAEGAPGSIGAAINTAVNIHIQIASATPRIETLFDANDSCFSGLSKLFDLSFSIPSLASVMSMAQGAVLQYAQKKVCTAVNRVTGLVTSPLNQAIDKINGLAEFGDIDGMVNGAIRKKMTKIDPELGREYHPDAVEGSYQLNTQPFSSGQTTFDSGSGGATGAPGTTYSQPAPTGSVAPQQPAPQQAPEKSWFESLSGVLN